MRQTGKLLVNAATSRVLSSTEPCSTGYSRLSYFLGTAWHNRSLSIRTDGTSSAPRLFGSSPRSLTLPDSLQRWHPSLLQGSSCSAQRSVSIESRAAAASRLSTQTERRLRAERERERKASVSAEESDQAHAVAAAPQDPADITAQDTSHLPAIQPSETVANEVQVSRVLGHSALVITRPIEWGTVLIGFEQQNRYTVYDESGQVVAQLAEDYTGLGNAIGRQLLKTRRSFTATVLSADGTQVIMRLKRPAYLINSHMMIEDGAGNVIGEVQQRWNLIKRNYDLYMDKRQFAAISGSFLAWEFELKDSAGGTLALIDRNFQGFGKELFTDAGKYVIHFGFGNRQAAADIASTTVRERSGKPDVPPVQPLTLPPTESSRSIIPTTTGSQLVVARSLALDERMIVLAAAIAIDYDYFSQHSHIGGGLFSPPLIIPMGGGGGAADTGVEAPAPPAGGASPEAGGDAGGASHPGSGGGESPTGVDEFPPMDGGMQSPQQPTQDFPPADGGWGWDNQSGGGDSGWSESAGGGGGEDGGGVGGVLGTLWGLFKDD